MKRNPISVSQLRELIHKGDAKDPLIFLESVMNGQDPRRLSSIYKMVVDIHDFTGGEPSKDDWLEVVDHIVNRYRYHPVTMNESMSAAKTLSEYLHAKRKQIELGDSSTTNNPAQHPLTEDEIDIFKEKFNDEF